MPEPTPADHAASLPQVPAALPRPLAVVLFGVAGGLTVATLGIAGFLAVSGMLPAVRLAMAVIAAPVAVIAAAAASAWLLARGRSELMQVDVFAGNAAHDMPAAGSLFGHTRAEEAQSVRGAVVQRLRQHATWPQRMIAMPFLLLPGVALAIVWGVLPTDRTGIGAAAIAVGVCAFAALVAERLLAAQVGSDARQMLPVVRVAALILGLATVSMVLLLVGSPGTVWIITGLLVVTLLVAGELLVRACVGCFLPPPPVDTITVWVRSAIAERLPGGDRRRTGPAWKESWALHYLRDAVPPTVFAAVLCLWLLSGVTVLARDERGVHEQGGKPIGVVGPGLHLHAPWPFARIRRTEFGTVHQEILGLGDNTVLLSDIQPEVDPPAMLDRLWDQTHPAESQFLVPGPADTDRRTAFHLLNADIRVLWRFALTDRAAHAAVYRVGDGASLVRRFATQALTEAFHTRTLIGIVGGDRDGLALQVTETIRERLAALDTGIDIVAVLIEAIHPPPTAAPAYHLVQAAGIEAQSRVTEARGRAQVMEHEAQQEIQRLRSDRQALAREIAVAALVEQSRFSADIAAQQVAGDVLDFERWLTAFAASLYKARVVVLDHRLDRDAVPYLDFRPGVPGGDGNRRP